MYTLPPEWNDTEWTMKRSITCRSGGLCARLTDEGSSAKRRRHRRCVEEINESENVRHFHVRHTPTLEYTKCSRSLEHMHHPPDSKRHHQFSRSTRTSDGTCRDHSTSGIFAQKKTSHILDVRPTTVYDFVERKNVWPVGAYVSITHQALSLIKHNPNMYIFTIQWTHTHIQHSKTNKYNPQHLTWYFHACKYITRSCGFGSR